MSRKRLLTQHLAPAAIVVASAAAALGFAGCAGEEDVGTCVSTEQYFAEQVWARTMSQKCIACHTKTGAAKDSKMVLRNASEAGYLEANLEIVRNVASFEREGQSLFLLKPTNTIEHGGGVQVVKGGSEYAAMKGLLARFDHPVDCPDDLGSTFANLEMLDWPATLRKSALLIAGRLPTAEETAAVEIGGEMAFEEVLGTYMNGEVFYRRLKQIYNDQFLTDQYLLDNVLDILPEPQDGEVASYNPGWMYNQSYDPTLAAKLGYPSDMEDTLRFYTQFGIAREPVELIEYVVKNNLPFTEILTANYTMVNPFSAKAYGITDIAFENDADPNEFQKGYFSGYDGKYPHAGVLTTPVFLIRHPTTPTNVNRHRARMVYQYFLGTDILKTAEQPLDPTKITDFNPTMNNSACTVCHQNIDPVAGAFHSFDNQDQARFNPGDTWLQEMRPPGFGTETVPYEQFDSSIQWLAQKVSADPRFALAAVFIMYEGLTGAKPLIAPSDGKAEGFKQEFKSYLAQYTTFNHIAKDFIGSNYNLKSVVVGILKSPYFRAVNAVGADAVRQLELGDLGMGQFNIPEQLDRKIMAVTGYPWLGWGNRSLLEGDYHILYGGIDSRDVTSRTRDPNGVMANIADRMANEMSCLAVPHDFALPAEQRRLFPTIDPTFAPKDANGFEVVPAVEAIKVAIQHLHKHILGEDLALDDPEILRTYNLFVALWDDGQKGMADPTLAYGTQLPWACQVHKDYWMVANAGWEATPDLPEDQKVVDDPTYTIRAWMGVVSYMLSDYAFLYE